ncbi:MAG: hypothetical protein ACRENI_07965 [Gemmatimonadaceae bacterium]
MPRPVWPGNKRFAFSIIDDTDVATEENVLPIYRLLERLGMRATKTVWPVGCPEGSRDFGTSRTLEDSAYLDFVRDLHGRGFEITWHGATMESSTRERTITALERFRDAFGAYPRLHANHARNRENLYWGADRVDTALLRALVRRLGASPCVVYEGHVERSRYWWGDLCLQHIEYVRNLTFNDVNLLRVNPSMPYHDPARPLVRWWFSACDAEDAAAFADLLRPENQDRLEAEGGVCIVATHFGKEFVRDGLVNPIVEERLAALARRPGWFPAVGELLDHLRVSRTTSLLPAREWRRMQWRWVRDLATRRLRRRRIERSGDRLGSFPRNFSGYVRNSRNV